MDDLVWFVTSFVAKNKQERWLFKLQRGLDQFFTMTHRNVDSQLNDRCRLAYSLESEAAPFVLERRLKHGVYYDGYTQGDPVRFDAKTGAFDWSGLKDGRAHDDSLIICRDRNTALYLHHEGWVWLCAL